MRDTAKILSDALKHFQSRLNDQIKNLNDEIEAIEKEEISDDIKKLKKEKIIEKENIYRAVEKLIIDTLIKETQIVRPDVEDIYFLLNSKLSSLEIKLDKIITLLASKSKGDEKDE